MQAYRFETKISKNGIIQIPLNTNLVDKEVEVIILQKQAKSNKNMSSEKFIEKWAGFLQNNNTETTKFEYLSNKYK